ncbi:MAG TPA: alpha/beta fold hydrolase [Puia sp.]|nr:alpha/beta fold hydrolase [Puia sp.]
MKINVLSLPFAGGNRHSFRAFQRQSPDYIKFVVLEYPGRGERTHEGLIRNIHRLVEDLFRQAKKHIAQGRYALYGHSLGGLATWLLARKIVENHLPPPVHLFITGAIGPGSDVRMEDNKRHLLGKGDFLQMMKDLQGMPDEMFRDSELLAYYEPILRADIQVSESYVHRELEPLDIPFTVISGAGEEGEPADYQIWQKETKRKVCFYQLPGGHFFILDHAREVVEIILKELSFYL